MSSAVETARTETNVAEEEEDNECNVLWADFGEETAAILGGV
jgi:hypothetical protein